MDKNASFEFSLTQLITVIVIVFIAVLLFLAVTNLSGILSN